MFTCSPCVESQKVQKSGPSQLATGSTAESFIAESVSFPSAILYYQSALVTLPQ